MNHFEAADKMRELAEKKFPNGYNGDAEIDWGGSICEGGHNVEGIFSDGKETLHLFWDAAFQSMDEVK